MKLHLRFLVACGLCVSSAYADVSPNSDATAAPASAQIKLPTGTDDYAKLVARAAAHDETVDFHALRFSHLTSPERQGGLGGSTDLQTDLQSALEKGGDKEIENAAIALLSADYTDEFAHAYLAIACDHLHDMGCAEQERFVKSGLERSILASGDGKSCDTGWEVATVHEEYFILAIMGARPKQQSLISGPHPCDMLSAEDHDGKPATYWFKIDVVMKDEMSALAGHQ